MKVEYNKFLEWTGGHNDAANFLYVLGKVSQDIDDIIDDGKSELLISALADLISVMGHNPFFHANAPALSSLMLSSLTMWAASNKFAQDKDKTTQIYGFVYRESLEQIIPFVAMLCGRTMDEAINIAEDVHRYYHCEQKQDTFEDWIKENNHG